MFWGFRVLGLRSRGLLGGLAGWVRALRFFGSSSFGLLGLLGFEGFLVV